MSESAVSFADDGLAAQNSQAQISAGAMLRRAREAHGLHIGALAVSLKVPVKKLEALEADRYDLLPDIVFARALASSVCRSLKIDPDPVLARLPHGTASSLQAGGSGINVPFRASREGAGLSLREQLSKPVVLAVLVLLVGAVVLVFFPFPQRGEVAAATKSETAVVMFAPPAPAPLAAEYPVPAEVVTPGPVLSLEASASDALLTVKPMPMASAASLPRPAASAAPAMVAGSGATSGVIAFTARGPCWVEVIDANGTVQLRKTMVAGEVVGATGVLPLSVVVGRADAAQVQVRGQAFDLTGVAKDNVARFEVK